MEKDFCCILYREPAIRAAIRRTARQLARDYEGLTPVVVGILKGAAFFMVHLVQELNIPLEIEFVQASSYGAALLSSGRIRRGLDTRFEAKGRHVLLVDDILDSGRTLSHFHAAFKRRGAASVKSAVLFDKPGARKIPYEADYPGLTVPDVWLTGYSLDYKGLYRNCRFVGILRETARIQGLKPAALRRLAGGKR
jgi:hypoxanthine phosphoribosyltransferase